jgi:hypothetical protein
MPQEHLQGISLADKIDEMEKKHNCKVEIHTDYQGLYLGIHDDTTAIRPLILTDDEYLRYRPKEDEPSEDLPAAHKSAEDEPAEDESAENLQQ